VQEQVDGGQLDDLRPCSEGQVGVGRDQPQAAEIGAEERERAADDRQACT
jgi:hypothetical protein